MINKRKKIFFIISIVISVLLIVILFNMSNNEKKDLDNNNSVFNIWIVWDKVDGMNTVIEAFKKLNTNYWNKVINVSTFADYESYYLTLSSAIIKWQWPDLFVLNNNEKKSIFEDQILAINPELIDPISFRSKFKWVFSDNLIQSITNEDDKTIEFLKGIPVWYETLWIFYNRRYVNSSNLDTLSKLNTTIANLTNKNKNIVPLAIGNGSTVYGAADIITQFFLLEDGVDGLSDIVWNKLKQALTTYMMYWDENWWKNRYNSIYNNLISENKTSIDYFSLDKIYMVVWYPRLINLIDKKWFRKNFLLANPFPHYFKGNWKTLINYNYFVVNKTTDEQALAMDILKFLSSDIWANNYLNNYPYYLPALQTLESDFLSNKIHPQYNITLKNFVEENNILGSFDKWIKNIYDKEIINILDNNVNFEWLFNDFKSKILCNLDKITTFENLSKDCINNKK
jgi:hypothetical protein